MNLRSNCSPVMPWNYSVKLLYNPRKKLCDVKTASKALTWHLYIVFISFVPCSALLDLLNKLLSRLCMGSPFSLYWKLCVFYGFHTPPCAPGVQQQLRLLLHPFQPWALLNPVQDHEPPRNIRGNAPELLWGIVNPARSTLGTSVLCQA